MKRLFLLLLVSASAWAQTVPATGGPYSASWTSATALGCPGAGCLQIPTQSFNAAAVTVSRAGTVTGGYVTFEGSNTPDPTVTDLWFSVACAAPTTAGATYDFASTGTQGLGCNIIGAQRFRARLTGTIAGSGTINISVNLASLGTPAPAISVAPVSNSTVAISQTSTQNGVQLVQPLPAGTNDIGTVDQTANSVWFGVPVLPPTTNGATVTRVVYMGNPYASNATPTGNASVNIKVGSANVWGYDVQNPNSTTCWLEFYNATAPSLGATRIWGVPILGSGGIAKSLPFPVNLSAALTIATTTTDAGGTTCSTGMGVTIYYQ